MRTPTRMPTRMRMRTRMPTADPARSCLPDAARPSAPAPTCRIDASIRSGWVGTECASRPRWCVRPAGLRRIAEWASTVPAAAFVRAERPAWWPTRRAVVRKVSAAAAPAHRRTAAPASVAWTWPGRGPVTFSCPLRTAGSTRTATGAATASVRCSATASRIASRGRGSAPTRTSGTGGPGRARGPAPEVLARRPTRCHVAARADRSRFQGRFSSPTPSPGRSSSPRPGLQVQRPAARLAVARCGLRLRERRRLVVRTGRRGRFHRWPRGGRQGGRVDPGRRCRCGRAVPGRWQRDP
jgi:hypothetical protein